MKANDSSQKSKLPRRALGSITAVILLSSVALASTPGTERVCLSPKDEYGNTSLVVESKNGKLLSDSISFMDHFEIGQGNSYLTRIQRLLKEKGVDLILVPIPPDGLIYADQLDIHKIGKVLPSLASYDYVQARNRYNQMISVLSKNGIPTISILDTAIKNKGVFFFLRDHHWTPRGAEISADFISNNIKKFISEQPSSDLKREIVVEGQNTQQGSYAIRALGCGWTFSDETYPRIRLQEPGLSLLEDQQDFVLLLGNSYASDYFSAYLSKNLGEEVVNGGVSAGGLTDAFIEYFNNPNNHFRWPKYVIWQFTAGQDNLDNSNFYREAIPLLSLPCNDSRALAKQQFNIPASGSQDVILSIPSGIKALGSDYFVNLQFSNLAIRKFTYFIKYGNTEEGVQFERSGRIKNNGIFNFSLSDTVGKTVDQIKIAFPEPVSGSVEVRLCKMAK